MHAFVNEIVRAGIEVVLKVDVKAGLKVAVKVVVKSGAPPSPRLCFCG